MIFKLLSGLLVCAVYGFFVVQGMLRPHNLPPHPPSPPLIISPPHLLRHLSSKVCTFANTPNMSFRQIQFLMRFFPDESGDCDRWEERLDCNSPGCERTCDDPDLEECPRCGCVCRPGMFRNTSSWKCVPASMCDVSEMAGKFFWLFSF